MQYRHSGPQRALVCLTCLMLMLSLVGCANGVGVFGGPSTATARPPVAPTKTATGAGGQFVCANPPGSSATYAFVGADHQMAIVTGCSALPRPHAAAGRQFAPIAFSPTGRWLLASDNSADAQDASAKSCLALIAVSSGAVTSAKLCNVSGFGPSWTQWVSFIGWASDASFYLASTSAQDNSVTVFFVSLPDLSQRVVTKLTWVASVANPKDPAGIVLRGDALYYGGYMSKSEGGAWLHRFSLTSETDMRIVRLGLAGFGGCQVADVPCQWTGPWDVSHDGSRIAYHNPGPTQSISDTSIEANTPLFLAGSDGSGAQRLFPKVALGQGFNHPAFSPDGHYIVTSFPNHTPQLPDTVVFERLSDGALTTAPAEMEWQSWAAQPGVAVMYNINVGGPPDYLIHLDLYNVATGAQTQLQAGSYDYVWA